MAYDVQKFSASKLDLSKIASSAGNAKDGNFLKVNENIFSSPGLEFKERKDGTIAIINNGTVIGFTVLDEETVGKESDLPTISGSAGSADVKKMEDDTVAPESAKEEQAKPEVTVKEEDIKPVVEEEKTTVPTTPEVKKEEPLVPPFTVETTGGPNGRGGSVDVPTSGQNGLTRDYTNYDYYFNKWTGGTRQRQMADLWNDSGRQEDADKGIAMYNGRYIIAMTETFGQVGDEVDVMLEDGTIIPCVLGDIKSMNDPNCTQYGHKLGGGPVSCVEWETTKPMDDASVLGDWRKQKVIQVINTGTSVI